MKYDDSSLTRKRGVDITTTNRAGVHDRLGNGTNNRMRLTIEIEREDEGRVLAEIPALPGVMAYGRSPAEATARVKALALRVLAERLEHGEPLPVEIDPLFLTSTGHEPVGGRQG